MYIDFYIIKWLKSSLLVPVVIATKQTSPFSSSCFSHPACASLKCIAVAAWNAWLKEGWLESWEGEAEASVVTPSVDIIFVIVAEQPLNKAQPHQANPDLAPCCACLQCTTHSGLWAYQLYDVCIQPVVSKCQSTSYFETKGFVAL